MATRILRRLYIYVAAFIGLQMLAAGIVELVSFLGERLFGSTVVAAASVAAIRLGTSVALVAVGLPLWASHWAFAQRDARQPEGQRTVLRRLYAYAVLLVAVFNLLFALVEGVRVALEIPFSLQAPVTLIRPIVASLVYATVWLGHWRLFSADREALELSGPNATLRRWYLALTLWMSLAMACFGGGIVLHGLLQRFVFAKPGSPWDLIEPAAALISGFLIWLPHEYWSRRLIRAPGPLQDNELGATLRQVYTALVITSALVAAFTGLTALISATLQAMLGVDTWAGAFGEETRAVAAVIVALPILFYYRQQLLDAARISGAAERIATARRLVSYLTGAVSLVALYFGLGGLIGTLLRLWLSASSIGVGWRTPLSWYTAMTIVALPVYAIVSWRSELRARGNPDEERTLARRIYLYAALLFGVIATVTTATLLIRLLIVAMLGQSEPGMAAEIGRYIGYSGLGGAICAVYAFLLRQAGAARGTLGAGWTIVLLGDESLRQALAAAFAHELPGARLSVASEQDLPERRAVLATADLLVMPLAALNDAALYTWSGPRLLLATPIEGFLLIGVRRNMADMAREAARTAGALYREQKRTPQLPAMPAPGLA